MINYSFIIPHHNSPDLLQRCIDSIPQREDIEIIVADDNSDDDKHPSIERKDVCIITIDRNHTKGAGHARNVAMAEATGKWLLFADCDDYYSQNFISALDEYKDDDIDVLYFNYKFIDGATGKLMPEKRLQQIINTFKGTREESDYIKFRNNGPWSKMVRHEYVISHKMYFEEVINGNDILFSLFVASYTDNIAVCDKKLYNYIKTPNSIVTSKINHKKFICRLTHVVKRNEFKRSIGYDCWNHSILKSLVKLVRRGKFSGMFILLFYAIIYLPRIYANQKEWVRLIKEHQ